MSMANAIHNEKLSIIRSWIERIDAKLISHGVHMTPLVNLLVGKYLVKCDPKYFTLNEWYHQLLRMLIDAHLHENHQDRLDIWMKRLENAAESKPAKFLDLAINDTPGAGWGMADSTKDLPRRRRVPSTTN